MAAILLLAGFLSPGPLAAASPEDPDWPCVQRKVPQISSGIVWTGPSIDEVGSAWRDDATVVDLARRIASRRTPIEEAEAAVESFAATAGPEPSGKLVLLMAGALDLINAERGSIIAGIERYAKRQRALAEKIQTQADELARTADAETEQDSADRSDLLEVQAWDTRIFEERERALSYVCEQPVLLEKRAFALGRKMMSLLD